MPSLLYTKKAFEAESWYIALGTNDDPRFTIDLFYSQIIYIPIHLFVWGKCWKIILNVLKTYLNLTMYVQKYESLLVILVINFDPRDLSVHTSLL